MTRHLGSFSTRRSAAVASLLLACTVIAPPPLAAVAAAGPAAFTPVAPCRLIDTRHDQSRQLDSHTIRLQVTGACGVPDGASAVALTIVATDTTGAGFIAAYPSSQTRPLASVLNYTAADTRANGTILALSPSGQVDVYTSSPAHLIIDTTGYFSPTTSGSATAGRFAPLPATRLVDTRSGSKISPTTPFPVNLPASVPSDAVAVAVNLTVVDPEQTGFLSVYPGGASPSETSVLNFPAASQPRAATVIVPVTTSGFLVRTAARTHLLIDISGYFTGPSAPDSADGLLVATSPTRLLDTRSPSSPLYPHGATEVATPPGAAVAILNVTMVPMGPGFLSATPAGTAKGVPEVSSVNAGLANRPVANMSIVATSTRGVELYSSAATHVVVDLNGYFTGASVGAGLPARPNVKPPNPVAGGCLSGPAESDKTGRWLQQTVNKWGKIGYYSGFGENGPLVIVGDSLTWQSIIPAMNTLIDRGYGPICLDGVISRNTLAGSPSITSARSAVDRIKASHPFWQSQSVRWVVAMGTNDIASTGTSVAPARQRIDAMVAAIGSEYFEIGWVNLRTRRGPPWTEREDVFNDQIAATPGVYVIDWATLVQPSPPTFIWQADLIHLTVVGQQARSDLTANQLDAH
ncbi:MAG: hypothetical protein WCC60_24310 [Ilumatobacteraceae bacterium]